MLSEKRKKQAIVSEHFLSGVTVDDVYVKEQKKGLYLTLNTKMGITKIPNIIKRVAQITKVTAILFKIGNSFDLLYDAEMKSFFCVTIEQSFLTRLTLYKELNSYDLRQELKKMKGSNK